VQPLSLSLSVIADRPIRHEMIRQKGLLHRIHILVVDVLHGSLDQLFN